MEAVRKLIVVLFGTALAIVLSILVMIHGWGLQPQSWWWIVGVGVGGQILAQTVIAMGRD